MGKGFINDGTAKRTIAGMAECLLAPGEINLGWNDISDVLLHDGETVIAFGTGTGKNRAIKACDDILSNYRTAARTIRRPIRLLFRLMEPENLLLKEVTGARKMLERSIRPASEVVFGVARDISLSDEIRIIVLTT